MIPGYGQASRQGSVSRDGLPGRRVPAPTGEARRPVRKMTANEEFVIGSEPEIQCSHRAFKVERAERADDELAITGGGGLTIGASTRRPAMSDRERRHKGGQAS